MTYVVKRGLGIFAWACRGWALNMWGGCHLTFDMAVRATALIDSTNKCICPRDEMPVLYPGPFTEVHSPGNDGFGSVRSSRIAIMQSVVLRSAGR